MTDDEPLRVYTPDELASMSDERIVWLYDQTSGEPGDPVVEPLVKAMREREIDF